MAVKQDGTLSGRSTDDYLAVLGDSNRRAVIEFLAENDRPVTISSLVRAVVAETRSVSLDAPSAAKIAQTKMELHHNHLPKLDDAGVIEYDPEEHLVAPADGLETALGAVELAN